MHHRDRQKLHKSVTIVRFMLDEHLAATWNFVAR